MELYPCAAATVYPSFAEGYDLPIITSRTPALVEFAAMRVVLLVDPSDTDALADTMRKVLTKQARQVLVAGINTEKVPVGWSSWAEQLLSWFIDGD